MQSRSNRSRNRTSSSLPSSPQRGKSSSPSSTTKRAGALTALSATTTSSRSIRSHAATSVFSGRRATAVHSLSSQTGRVSGTSTVSRRRIINQTLPTHAFHFDPVRDFPRHQDEGAVTLFFDHSEVEATPQTGEATGTSGSCHSSKTRPLRIAVASSGLSKELVREVENNGQSFLVWDLNELKNFSVPGEDIAYVTGEDALISGHVSADSDTRHQYVRLDSSKIPQGIFNHQSLPLPVFTPVHSKTAKNEDLYNDTDMDYSKLTHVDLKSEPNLMKPLTKRVVLGVADGVGGMSSYGKLNNTKMMSHQLMRLIRQHLTATSNSARELLGQAYYSLLASNNVNIGACTGAVALVRPSPRVEPEDEFDDGLRLKVSVANAGDSSIAAFRPKPITAKGKLGYTPLYMAWPMHHRWNSDNPPPFQFTVSDVMGKPPTTPEQPNIGGPLTSSHYDTPTTQYGEKCPSGGDHVYVSPKDYRDVLAGKRQLGDFIRDHETLSKSYKDVVNLVADLDSDVPWMAQGVDDLTLRRGDVICVFSDGIADNLRTHIFTHPISESWEALVGYVNPAIRAKHPLLKNVRNLRQEGTTHLGNAVLHQDGLYTREEIQEFADKINEMPELDCDTECIVAGTLSSMMAGGLVRLAQKGFKVDDMSVVVGVVY